MSISAINAAAPQFAGNAGKTQKKSAQPQFSGTEDSFTGGKKPAAKSQLPIISPLLGFLSSCIMAPIHLLTGALGGLSSHVLRPLLKVISFGYLG